MGNGRAYRLTAIDMLRGLAIVIMAIDHVRDFFLVGTSIDPMARPQRHRWAVRGPLDHPLLRAGVRAAGRHQCRPDGGKKEPQRAGRFLFTRGVWLIAVEIFVIATAWSLAPGGIARAGGRAWTSMQVIWAIGASMVALVRPAVAGRRLPRARRRDGRGAQPARSDLAGQSALRPAVAAVGRPAFADVVSARARSCSSSAIRCCPGSA